MFKVENVVIGLKRPTKLGKLLLHKAGVDFADREAELIHDRLEIIRVEAITVCQTSKKAKLK